MERAASLLLEPLQYGFMQRALIVSLLAGLACPMLGVIVVTREMGFLGDALAHSVLPGMVGAFLLGVSPLWGALPAAVAMALLVGFLMRRAGVSADTAIGILFVAMFALGLTMLTASRGLPVNLEDVLLGQVLGASWTDVALTATLALAVLAILAAAHKELAFASFDPAGAAVLGLPTTRLDYALLALLAVGTVMALQSVGIVLVVALLITPAATALLWARTYVRAMAIGAALGAAAVVIGLYASYYFNLTPGPLIALVATGFFGAGTAARARRARGGPLPALQ